MKQHIVFVLDKSGSMESIRERVTSGFNEFLDDQKREAERRGDSVFLTLVLFDSPVFTKVQGQIGYVVAYNGENIHDVPGLTKETYVPGGGTALLDAIDRALDDVGSCDGADRVLMVIMTDGEENSSVQATKDGVRAKLEERQAAGWAVVYMGANVDEFAEAGAIGIDPGGVADWEATQHGTTAAMVRLSRASERFLGGRSGTTDFWVEEEAE